MRTQVRVLSRCWWFPFRYPRGIQWLAAIVCLVTCSLHGATLTARWIGGSGNWAEVGHWDIGVVPNNAGGANYVAVIDSATEALEVVVNTPVTVSGLYCGEMLRVAAGGTCSVAGVVTNRGTIVAGGGQFRVSAGPLDNTGAVVMAEDGVVTITEVLVSGGTLRATDLPTSLIRFSGDVTLVGVTWDDPGAGEFQVYNTNARLLGDFAAQMPAGCTLVVMSKGTHTPVVFTLPAGSYANHGAIELRHDGGGWNGFPRLEWAGSGTVSGTGVILMSGEGDSRANMMLSGAAGAEVRLGSGQRVHGRGEIRVNIVNEGLVEADVAGRTLLASGRFENLGTLRATNEATLTLTGTVINRGELTSQGGTLSCAGATIDNVGRAIVAQEGLVYLSNASVTGGVLRVTSHDASRLRFQGDVVLDDVTWEDTGLGEFQVYNTTARLLGDFASALPSGCVLVVESRQRHELVQLTLLGGVFQNAGTIELRHDGGGWNGFPRLHWEASGTLAGNGEVHLSGVGDSRANILFTGAPGVEVTIGSGQWVHGYGEIQVPLVNQGTVEADVSGRTLRVTGAVSNQGTLQAVSQTTLALVGGVVDTGTLGMRDGGDLTLGGQVVLHQDLVAGLDSVLRLTSATADFAGHSVVADRGLAILTDSVAAHGKLRVTADEASLVRFSGDVTLTDIQWQDDGAGEFQVYNTTARLLGDYANLLPSGYTLVIESLQRHEPTVLTMPVGVFTNQGVFELRHDGRGWNGFPRLHWAGSGALEGFGEVYLSGSGDVRSDLWLTAEPGATLRLGPDQWVHGHGNVKLALINQGIVESDFVGRTLTVSGSVDNQGDLWALKGAVLALEGGVADTGRLAVQDGGQLVLGGLVSLHQDLVAGSNSLVRLTGAGAGLQTHRLTADHGVVELANSAVSNGVLRVTDHASSVVRFVGDVTLVNVTWEDPGLGEFRVENATARLLGDYERHLPAGCALTVYSHNTHTPASLLMPAGEFVNDGLVQLRHDGSGWSGYPRLHWEMSGSLAGSGEVLLSGAGDVRSYVMLTGAEGVALTIGSNQRVHGRGELQLDVVNLGTLEANVPGRPLRVSGDVVNEGLLRAAAGCELLIAGRLVQDGRLQVAGGKVEVEGDVALGAHGTVETSASGVLQVGRHFEVDAGNTNAAAATAALVLDGGGVPRPELSDQAFFVEAEDFNYNRGQHLPVADTMPYYGGAYEGLGGRDRIDYHQTANVVASDLYRTESGFNVNIFVIGDRDRGTYAATNTLKVGYNDADDWYNYTRTFPTPAPAYYVFARLSSGGQSNAVWMDEVVGPASTTTQELSKLGEFRAPATGDYNRFAFVPLRDDSGGLVELNWTGTRTFRATILAGGNEDMDYFVFAPAFASGPAQLIEVTGEDLGPSVAGFGGNLALDSLAVAAGSVVRLVDLTDNAPGAPEVLYVDSLVVPAGTTLDLNGLKLFARNVQVAGTVVGGTVSQVSGEPPTLGIRMGAQGAELFWPTAAGTFVLEWTAELPPAAGWKGVAAVPVSEGEFQVVREAASQSTRFYRLRSP